MSHDKQRALKRTILWLFVFLAIWAAVIAAGVMRQPNADARKAIFIVATVVAFVSLWVAALAMGKSRKER